jgi:hypothetical protein
VTPLANEPARLISALHFVLSRVEAPGSRMFGMRREPPGSTFRGRRGDGRSAAEPAEIAGAYMGQACLKSIRRDLGRWIGDRTRNAACALPRTTRSDLTRHQIWSRRVTCA